MGNRIRFVLCDVDGCLTPEDPVAPDAAALASIARRQQRIATGEDLAGLTLCTGRPQPFAELLCRMLHVRLPLIAENGVWLYDPVRNRYLIDPAIGADDLAAVDACREWLRTALAGSLADGAIQPGKTASVSLYSSDHAALAAALPRVQAQVQAAGWPIRVSMSWYYINCDLGHISKATGIARWRGLVGAEAQELAGIGDTLGDLAIADSVAVFACPANADERLKTRAAYVAAAREAAGVAEILDHLDRRR